MSDKHASNTEGKTLGRSVNLARGGDRLATFLERSPFRTPANDMRPTDADPAAARRFQSECLETVGQGARSDLSSILNGLATFTAGEWPDVGRATRRRDTAIGAFILSIDWRRGLFGLWMALDAVQLIYQEAQVPSCSQ